MIIIRKKCRRYQSLNRQHQTRVNGPGGHVGMGVIASPQSQKYPQQAVMVSPYSAPYSAAVPANNLYVAQPNNLLAPQPVYTGHSVSISRRSNQPSVSADGSYYSEVHLCSISRVLKQTTDRELDFGLTHYRSLQSILGETSPVWIFFGNSQSNSDNLRKSVTFSEFFRIGRRKSIKSWHLSINFHIVILIPYEIQQAFPAESEGARAEGVVVCE